MKRCRFYQGFHPILTTSSEYGEFGAMNCPSGEAYLRVERTIFHGTLSNAIEVRDARADIEECHFLDAGGPAVLTASAKKVRIVNSEFSNCATRKTVLDGALHFWVCQFAYESHQK